MDDGDADVESKIDEGSAIMSKEAPVPRGRAKRRPHVPADERRRQIIKAAQDAFSRTSLQGASTREIAKAAEVNPATLFEHFGSKEALFREAVITPLIESMGELKARVRVYHRTRSRAVNDEIAKAGVATQMEVMQKLFPLFTSALFSDLEAGRELYKEHIVPHLLEREAMIRGLASDETDPYFVELAALGLLFAIAMDETFTGGRLSRAEYADQFIRLFSSGTARESHGGPHESPGSSKVPLHRRRALGPSELFVSPLVLGTMRFGTPAGPSGDELQRIFDLYLQSHGNLVEIENHPTDEQPQDLVANLIRGRRHELVLSSHQRLLPPDGGEGPGSHYRNRLIRSVEQSLARLGTDCIDLLYLSVLDGRVRVEEALSACEDLIREGKIRYAGMSNIPAWQAARIQAIAEVRGRSPIVALRVCHGLTARGAEQDSMVMAHELGLGVISVAPCKDTYIEDGKSSEPNAARRRVRIAAVIEAVAQEQQRTPAQVALIWKFQHSAVVSSLVYPQTAATLEESIGALDIVLDGDQIARLDAVSRPDLEDAQA